jgi:hypothetical protein
MGKAIAVQGCTLVISSGGSGPNPTVTSQPSTQVLINTKGVFFKEIKFSVSGANAGEITNSDGHGSGTILATGTYVLDGSGNKVVLLDDESASVTLNGTKPGSEGPEPATGTIKVKVSNAGQTDVIAL